MDKSQSRLRGVGWRCSRERVSLSEIYDAFEARTWMAPRGRGVTTRRSHTLSVGTVDDTWMTGPRVASGYLPGVTASATGFTPGRVGLAMRS